MKNPVIISCILAVALYACSKPEVNNKGQKNIEPILIGKAYLKGGGYENIEKGNLIITNTVAWNQLLDKMDSVNVVSDNFTETNIDFSRFIILAVFDEVQGEGGHSIDIVRIVEGDKKIKVTVTNILKGNDLTIMTQPYHIVKIPVMDKPIVFEQKP